MKIPFPTEDQEQAKLCTWLTLQRIRFFAIPNGGYRNFKEAVKFKRCGVQPGVPDLCIPIPSGMYHGLYIELKRQAGGKVTDYQVDWIRFLREMGYYAEIAHGFDDAKTIIVNYLALTPKAA